MGRDRVRPKMTERISEHALANRRNRPTRFIRSYKYKHKRQHGRRLEPAEARANKEEEKITPSSCDPSSGEISIAPEPSAQFGPGRGASWTPRRRPPVARRAKAAGSSSTTGLGAAAALVRPTTKCTPPSRTTLGQLIVWLVALQSTASRSNTRLASAFCPFKCNCDDRLLSANCTQVSSISIVPMTLNPLLKRLTLNQLPMFELSNSLSVYRQLEYLNLNSNQLRQIKYQNFNFKAAPQNGLTLKPNNHQQLFSTGQSDLAQLQLASTTRGQVNNLVHLQGLNEHNEHYSRHLKQTIDKSLSYSVNSHATNTDSAIDSNINLNTNNEDQIGLHLRELHLCDNKIEQLGDLGADHAPSSDQDQQQQQEDETNGGHQELTRQSGSTRLKSAEIERLAPFLTLTRLEYLDLSGNKLTRLHRHVFLGLLKLKYLDLSRNRLEFVDRHAFVGLIELRELLLRQNKLASQLAQLGITFCRAPMVELLQLDLSDNLRAQNVVSGTSGEILLPNQMFICAPRLIDLRLSSLQLRYIQANAFDNLQQLQMLNLSANHLEQVPTDSFSYSNCNMSSSLLQLDLSETLIEFVNANSFGPLKRLEKLFMNSMPHLVSFDLAAFLPPESSANNQDDHHQHHRQRTTATNYHLNELHLRHNARLQSFHSSLALRPAQHTAGTRPRPRHAVMSLPRLKLLDLHGASELRELPLDEMLDLNGAHERLQVDLSLASNLNCSSCQMGWLMAAAAREQQRLNQSPNYPARLADAHFGHDNNIPVPAFANGWNPVPFDPYQAYRPNLALASQHQRPAADQLIGHEASSPGQQSSRVVLVSGHSIGCSWPLAMPLVDLVNLDHSSVSSAAHCRDVKAAHHRPAQHPSSGAEQQQQEQPAGASADIGVNLATGDNQTQAGGEPTAPTGAGAGSLLAGCLLAVVLLALTTKSILALVARRRCKFEWRSPSFATTSIGSPASSSGSSASSRHSTEAPIVGPADLYQAPVIARGNEAAAGRHMAAAAHQFEQLESNAGKANGPLELQFSSGGQQNNRRALLFSKLRPQCRRLGRALHADGRRGGNLLSRIVGRLSKDNKADDNNKDEPARQRRHQMTGRLVVAAAPGWQPRAPTLNRQFQEARQASSSSGAGAGTGAQFGATIQAAPNGLDIVWCGAANDTHTSCLAPGVTGGAHLSPSGAQDGRQSDGHNGSHGQRAAQFIRQPLAGAGDAFIYANCQESSRKLGASGMLADWPGGGAPNGPANSAGTNYSNNKHRLIIDSPVDCSRQMLVERRLGAIGGVGGDGGVGVGLASSTCQLEPDWQCERAAECGPLQAPSATSRHPDWRQVERTLARYQSSGRGAPPTRPVADSAAPGDAARHQVMGQWAGPGAAGSAPFGHCNDRARQPAGPVSLEAGGGQPLDGHIYVTLDGPIKQQNGCDEYEQLNYGKCAPPPDRGPADSRGGAPGGPEVGRRWRRPNGRAAPTLKTAANLKLATQVDPIGPELEQRQRQEPSVGKFSCSFEEPTGTNGAPGAQSPSRRERHQPIGGGANELGDTRAGAADWRRTQTASDLKNCKLEPSYGCVMSAPSATADNSNDNNNNNNNDNDNSNNVTGAPDCGSTRQSAGRQLLAHGRAPSCEPAPSCARQQSASSAAACQDKYDANHGAATASAAEQFRSTANDNNTTKCDDDDYAINGLRNSVGWPRATTDAPRAPAGLDGRALALGAPVGGVGGHAGARPAAGGAGGAHNEIAPAPNDNSIVISQQKLAKERHHNLAPAGAAPPPDAHQIGGPGTGAPIGQAGRKSVAGAAGGQQATVSNCDMGGSLGPNNWPLANTIGGSPARPRQYEPQARAKQIGNDEQRDNEIYRNQFYYCKLPASRKQRD